MCKLAKKLTRAGYLTCTLLLTYTLIHFIGIEEVGSYDVIRESVIEHFDAAFTSGLILFAAGAIAELIDARANRSER